MKHQIKSELIKMRTTKTAFWLFVGMIFFAGPGILLAGQMEIAELSKPLHSQIWFFITAGFTRLLVIVLGIRLVTDEFRHGTIVPTMLAAPQRTRVVVAKGIAAAGVGFVLTLLAELVMVGSAYALITARGAEFTITDTTMAGLAGMALAGGLWGAIGVGIGAVVRHQIAAIVGALLWWMPGGGIEELVRGQIGKVGDYLPGNIGMALSLAPAEAVWGLAALALVAYAAAAIGAGNLMMKRIDI